MNRRRGIFTAVLVLSSILANSIPTAAAVKFMPDGQPFDPVYYYESNPDVAAAFGTDENALYLHYQMFGLNEGRLPYRSAIELRERAAATAVGTQAAEQGTDAAQAAATATATAASASTANAATSATQATATAAAASATATATATQPFSAFEQEVRNYLAQAVTDDMTSEVKLRAAYDYLVDHTVYGRALPNRDAAGAWMQPAAKVVYETGKGNCYQFAAAMGYIARELGYETRVQAGRVSQNTRGVVEHGWIVVTIDGQDYVIDPEMAVAHKNKDLFYLVKPENYPVPPLVVWQEWTVNF